jgi:O-antigen/teichoic acid export membrane protein
VQAAARSAGLWLSSAWRPSRGFDRAAARDLLHFGGHLAGANALNYWVRSVDQLAVGAVDGARQLGLYSRANQLMLLPLTQVTFVSGRVMFPALSRLVDAPERARRAYLRAVALIAFVTFPLMAVLFVAAVPLIRVLLGSQWAGAVPIFRLLCVVGVLQSITATAGWLYQSRGRTSWMLRWGVVNLVVTCIAVAIGVHWGAVGVAAAYAVRTAIVAGPVLALSGSLVGLRLRALGRALGGIAAAAVVAGLATAGVDYALSGAAPIVRLAGDAAAGALVYVGVVAFAKLEAYGEARALVARLRRRSAPA